MGRDPGWTLPETLLVVGLVGWVATLAWRDTVESVAVQRLQTASQRVTGGLDEGRAAALRMGQPCGLRLGAKGWEAPRGSGLPSCLGVSPGLGTGVDNSAAEPEVSHNLPDPVRFTANGLVLDGGTVWLRSPATSLVRCVVVSLPLGVTRVGREGPSGCEPEASP
ncbi:MAG: GspH/FimT family pseudopilin [Cyanobacteriota bacterium]|nr:GspH/FimT family pseudopilin [Cyanobacteriota bacterium]